MQIWHIRHQDINKQRWDRSIKQAKNGLLYAWSWYLDVVTPGWEALVNHDYSAIMPLPARSKYKIDYVFQPILTQQLGLFSASQPDQDLVEAFLRNIPRKFRWVQTTLNQTNQASEDLFKLKKHSNYELDLVLPYTKLSTQYNGNTRRNIKKSKELHFSFESDISPAEFLTLLSSDSSKGSRILLSEKNEETFIQLVHTLKKHKACLIPGLRNAHGELLAAALIGFSHKRYHYLAPAVSETGREHRAMFALIDRFIDIKSGSARVLDFEGSDIKNLARFYRGFGARQTEYFSLQINRFRWPVNNFFLLLSGNR